MKKNGIEEQLIKMLNQALELEHAARIQYLAHAELVQGLNAEKLLNDLKRSHRTRLNMRINSAI